jgi:hypothetical protein
MINLLSRETKTELLAARRNVVLRRHLFLIGIVLLAVGAVYGYGFWRAAEERRIATESNETALRNLESYADTKKIAEQYRSDLTTAKQILGSEFMFSEFLIDTAGILPPNTILGNLTMTTKQAASATRKAGAMSLQARAKSYDDALKLKEALESSELFTDVKITSISRPDKLEGLKGINASYPYEISLDVVVTTLGAQR